LGIPILQGRPFLKSDTATSLPVVIINRALARLLGPEDEAVGKEFDVEGQKKRVIVGVVEDARFKGLGEPPEPQFYLPYIQNPRASVRFNLVMRQAAAAGPLDSELRQVLMGVDRNAALLPVTSMDSVVHDTLAPPRLRTVLLGTSTFAALALALLGVYGLMSYVAAARRRELALRLAMVEKEALKLTAAGLVIGLLAGAGLAKVMSVRLLEAQPLEMTGVVAAALLMACCALAASFFPALRASRVAPMDALRHE
jgi:putative ABC transport system permease protein